MFKRRVVKKIAAAIIAATVLFSNVTPSIGTMNSVQAASEYSNENLLVNPDFEENREFTPAGGSHAGNWFVWQSASKTTSTAQSGNTSVKFSGNDSALEQDITGLQVGMTYVFSIWAKVSGANATSAHVIGVKNHGGAEIKQEVKATDWQKYEIEFTCKNGEVRLYGWVDRHEGVDMYIDNASLVAKSDVASASIQNGELTVQSSGTALSATDFTATYSTSIDSSVVKELNFTEKSSENGVLVLSFPEVEAKPVQQTVTVNITYKQQTFTLDYVIEASGDTVVTADMESVQATNGTVHVVLNADPTVKPSLKDFTWMYRVETNEEKALTVKEFFYDSESKTVSVCFDKMRGVPTGEQAITVSVTYNEQTMTDRFVVPVATANTYYVDSTLGKDTNDGLTQESAFRTISKLNTITFVPGDKILFKKGETFQGCFKPQGSGVEGSPIVVGTYGDENASRPVLIPGEDWSVPYIMSANAIDTTTVVNYVIQFYNVEYWEVKGLEIYDPSHEEYLDRNSSKYVGRLEVYRSGITIQAEDIGTLEHIYIDDVVVHGFHGPLTNLGKTSGGITMNVITNQQRNRALSVPTQINDIRITNCEIYDVGRSGINFLTPWSFRTEEKWGPFNYGTRSYEYLPYEDFYMANNYIHDIDGDGTIIDNCSNAVSEYNLVTRCCLRPAAGGGGAAVGLFNWNSDDTYFQFNEVYDIRPGEGSTASNDSQGIEIDALNDRTWVQYNYVHDNYGGFMMYCNVGDYYRSFDGIVRYNISQDDYAHPRQGMFDIYSANYGTEIYNNTFYLTERAVSQNGYGQHVDAGELFLFSAVGAYETMKFYNNIFYYDGETPVVANTFGDNAIDWQSNIFYRFTNLPQNDNEGNPNMNMDPKLVHIGSGTTGAYPGDKADLTGYYLTADSPAINAGVPLENNGGRDYFGNPVTGIPDIGAYESGSVELKVLSTEYAVNQTEKTLTVDTLDKVTAEQLVASLVTEDGVTVELKRGGSVLTGAVRVAENDVIIATYEDETIVYTVKTVTGTIGNVIPVADMKATAGSQEIAQSNDYATNVLDGQINTIWHTAWGGAAKEDRYITIELGKDYEVSGYIYTPRTGSSSGAVNGIITKYEIYTSDDNQTWKKASAGTWERNSDVKTVVFETPVKAKYVKLLAVESVNDFVSAAEIRLEGTRVYSDVEKPTTPVVTVSDITETSAVVTWEPSTDNEGILEYQLMNGDQLIATFEPEGNTYTVTGLKRGTTYTLTVYAVDEAGNKSEAGEVTVTTLGEPEEDKPVDKPEEKPENKPVEKPNADNNDKAPVTGDASSMMLWFLLMVVSSIVLVMKKRTR